MKKLVLLISIFCISHSLFAQDLYVPATLYLNNEEKSVFVNTNDFNPFEEFVYRIDADETQLFKLKPIELDSFLIEQRLFIPNLISEEFTHRALNYELVFQNNKITIYLTKIKKKSVYFYDFGFGIVQYNGSDKHIQLIERKANNEKLIRKIKKSKPYDFTKN